MDELERAIRNLCAETATYSDERRVFEELYPRVLRFFRRKGITLEEAEDYTQEALVRVFKQASLCRDPRHFRSWVFAVASNLYRNELRSKGAIKRLRQEVPMDEPSVAGEIEAAELGDRSLPDQSTLEREFQQALDVSIAALPTKRKSVLILSYQGRPQIEIAEILGISPNTVKSHLHQARQELKTKLSDYLQPERLKS